MLGAFALPESEVKTTEYFFEKNSRKDKDSTKIKCSILGKTSKVQTLDDLLAAKPKIDKSPGTSFGGGLKTANEIGHGIHLYYGYKDEELWYGVRWVKKI